MHKKAFVYAILVFFGLVSIFHVPVTPTAAASDIQLAQSSPEKTQLMQQSDHHRRLDRDRKVKTSERQVATVTPVESHSAGFDVAILIILVASAMILILFSTRKRRAKLRR